MKTHLPLGHVTWELLRALFTHRTFLLVLKEDLTSLGIMVPGRRQHPRNGEGRCLGCAFLEGYLYKSSGVAIASNHIDLEASGFGGKCRNRVEYLSCSFSWGSSETEHWECVVSPFLTCLRGLGFTHCSVILGKPRTHTKSSAGPSHQVIMLE